MSRARDTADQINRVNSSAADATAITVDSSENVLVGTTDSTPYDNTSGNGILLGDGLISSAQEGGNTAIFNRMTSDGSIVQFRKDGTTVGSIGAHSSGTYLGTADTGIYFNSGNDSIDPYNPSVPINRDNAISLGAGSRRFKDAYLSGGIYLGGVGSANKLEDYEEGTWTPVDGSGQVTLTDSPVGVYTKVGRQVTVIAYFAYPSNSQTNYAIVAGLPFTVSNYSNAMYAPGSIQTSYISSTNRHLAPLAYKNTNTFYFYDSEMPLTNANLSGKNFRINITYFTDA